ncbi:MULTISPECIES: hypothetical protein [Micrococcaceae]|uniref:hypothetical protein n=1 Tax=Micrococcaceae TaxID=1268 RepID=UPI0011BE4BFD|nr:MULTISPECIES: hypothetical protein [Micrococcaceae]
MPAAGGPDQNDRQKESSRTNGGSYLARAKPKNESQQRQDEWNSLNPTEVLGDASNHSQDESALSAVLPKLQR